MGEKLSEIAEYFGSLVLLFGSSNTLSPLLNDRIVTRSKLAMSISFKMGKHLQSNSGLWNKKRHYQLHMIQDGGAHKIQ